MDDDLAYRAARRTLAGDYLGSGADMILGCRFPEIDDIQAGKIQDIDGHYLRPVDVKNPRQQNCSGV